MSRNKTEGQLVLKYQVKTRVAEPTFNKLQKILEQQPQLDMSSLVRSILENRHIRVFTHDRSLDILMEELAALRAEIKAIGININQITRLFNTYPSVKQKEFYGKIAFDKYITLESKIERVLEIISKLSNRWLSE